MIEQAVKNNATATNNAGNDKNFAFMITSNIRKTAIDNPHKTRYNEHIPPQATERIPKNGGSTMNDLFSAQNQFFSDIALSKMAKQLPLIDCGDDVSLRILTEVTEEDFCDYREAMQTTYPALREESIASNRFLSVQHDDGYLYVIYSRHKEGVEVTRVDLRDL